MVKISCLEPCFWPPNIHNFSDLNTEFSFFYNNLSEKMFGCKRICRDSLIKHMRYAFSPKCQFRFEVATSPPLLAYYSSSILKYALRVTQTTKIPKNAFRLDFWTFSENYQILQNLWKMTSFCVIYAPRDKWAKSIEI